MVENRQEEALAIIGIFTAVAFIFLATRLYSRYLGRNYGWDDYFIIVSAVLLLASTITTWEYILLSGTGYHMRDLPKKTPHQQVTAMRWNFCVQMLYHPLMGAIRASIIMFLFRMKDNRRRIRYSLHVVFWLNILYAVGATLVNIFQCSPIRYAWEKAAMDHIDASGKVIKAGRCINTRTFVLSSCAFSIFLDLIIIPIPSVMVWNLQMNIRTKLLVVIVMSLGWIATGVSMGRFIVYYYRFAPTNLDRTWDIGNSISIAEPSIHIITACAPATKCLFRYLFPSFAAERTAAYYEERRSTQTPKMSKFGSRMSRGTTNFNFGFTNNVAEDTIIESRSGAANSSGDLKAGHNIYDLQPLDSETTEGGDEGLANAAGKEMRIPEAPKSSRTSCSKTVHTAASEAFEAELTHCLGQAKWLVNFLLYCS